MEEVCHPIASRLPSPATVRTALLLASTALWASGCDIDPMSDRLAGNERAVSVASTSGHVTNLCGYPVPLASGHVGPSVPGACESTCSSGWSNGTCQDPADSQSSIQVYGCAGQTAGGSCDGNTNGGLLLATYQAGETVSVSDFWNDERWCTIQIDVLRPTGGDPVGLRDFLVWERDVCGPPPPPPPCDCPNGADYLGNPVHGTECGQPVCGGDFQWYSCEQTGWVAQGGECPEEPPCDCPNGYDFLGNPVHGTECGQPICGGDFQWYSCQETGWVSEGGTCPDMGPCTVRPFIDTVEQLVDAVFRHDLTCANVRIPIDLFDPGSPVAAALAARYYAENPDDNPVEHPNKWRTVFYGLQAPNVRFFETVTYVNFKHVDLSGAFFEDGCDNSWFLTPAPGRSNLTSATFRGAIEGCVFIGADLRNAVFENGVVQKSSFEYADLTGAAFHSPALVQNDFNDAIGTELVNWPTTPEGMLDLDVTSTTALCAKLPRENGFGGTELARQHDFMLPHIQLNDPVLVAAIEAQFGMSLESMHSNGVLYELSGFVIGYDHMQRLLGSPWRSYLYETLPGQYRKRAVFDAVDGRYGAYSACNGAPERPLRGPSLHHLSLDGTVKWRIEDALLRMLRADSGSAVFLDDPFGGRTSTSLEGNLDASIAGFATAEDWDAFLLLEGTDANRLAWNSAALNYELEDVGLSQTTVNALVLAPAAAAELQALAQDTLVSVRDLAGATHRAAIVAALFDYYLGT